MKVLLVEDQAELAHDVRQYLDKEAILCEWAGGCEDAMDKLASFQYDLVLLDIMLPDGNGMDILRFIKKELPNLGVLIISAKNALDDKLTGFELGADDYMTKPFHLAELNARIKAFYRRQKFEGQDRVEFNEISINTEEREVKINSQSIELTGKEYDLLLYLLANKNRVLTKQAIAEHLWGDYVGDWDHFDFVYQHIKNLRRKLSDRQCKPYIATVYGLGYKFNTAVE